MKNTTYHGTDLLKYKYIAGNCTYVSCDVQ